MIAAALGNFTPWKKYFVFIYKKELASSSDYYKQDSHLHKYLKDIQKLNRMQDKAFI